MTDLLTLENIHFSVDDGLATVLLDRQGESMNTLSRELAEDLVTVVERIENDPEITAVVIGSAKPSGFFAGADIRMLRSLEDGQATHDMLSDVHGLFARIENLHTDGGRPVVAAIHGPCLGAGLELAMACGMRVCSNDASTTQLGQPEVKLGVIPGAGGTQRLPRLVGIAAGLDLMLTGRSVRPYSALKMGLVDEIVPAELVLDVAQRRARERAETSDTREGPSGGSSNGGPLAAVKSWLSPKHLQELALEDNPVGRRVLFAKATEQMMEETKGNYPAPKAIIRVVKTGVEDGIDAGYAAELDEFANLVVTPQAKALMQLFLDSQAAKRSRGADAEPRPIDKTAVIGGGLMGGGIAVVNTVNAGVRTRVKEVDTAALGRAFQHVHSEIAGFAKKRRVKPAKSAELVQLVTGSTDWSGFGDADLVIEAVFEDLELKRKILADVEGITSDDAIFASNTSSLPIADIAAGSKRPQNVIGMHYFSPVEKMPLLEVIVTDTTADWVIATAVAFGKQQGKTVIVVNDDAGFYTTRVLGPYTNEAFRLLAEGVPIRDIDDAMVQWGFPVGPFQLMDEVGIDVGAKITKIMQDAFGDRMAPPPELARLVEGDRRGRKSGRGFYRYEEGRRKGVDETVYADLGVETATKLPISTIQDRVALPFVAEAVRCLADGVLRSARDGDVGAVFGLGFPPFRGGPFMFIDQTGADRVVWKMEKLADQHGDRFAPPEALRARAEGGEPFRTDRTGQPA